MTSAAGMIKEWMGGGEKKKRCASALSRKTGVSAAELSAILSEKKKPSMETIVRLGKAMPAELSIELLCEVDPDFRDLFKRFLSSKRAEV
jgi:DNA-binding phage protein